MTTLQATCHAGNFRRASPGCFAEEYQVAKESHNELKITRREISELAPYPNNARTHSKPQIRKIAESIRSFGFTNPILIDARDTIVAGHGRVEAAKLLKLIFGKANGKANTKNPDTETFGTNFDDILQMCFDVYPPISELPREEISKLLKSENEQEIAEGMKKLGNSVDKAFVADKLRQLKKKGKS